MKNEAERRGADEAPISSTLGMESGSGVVSMRTCWLKLFEVRGVGDRSGEEGGGTLVPWLSGRHGGGGEVLVETMGDLVGSSRELEWQSAAM